MSSLNKPPLLLVDGYNVIGTWTYLKKLRDEYNLDDARHHLIESLINYSASVGYNTQVVFDAHYQKTPGYNENLTKHLSVYYTAFSETADTYIEKFCASFHHYEDKYSRLLVATSDYAQRLTVTGYGAQCLSSQKLVAEIESTAKHRSKQKRPQKNKGGRFLMNSLDIQAQQKLRALLNQ